MRARLSLLVLIAILTLLLAAPVASAQGPEPQAALGSAFTYQGRLLLEGVPANGSYDFEFRLFSAASGDAQVGGPVAVNGVQVVDGLFSVTLDFGASAFDGQARWLEIRVRAGGAPGGHTILTPRQRLTPAPGALWSQRAPWSGLVAVPSGFADGVDDDTTYGAGTGLVLDGGSFRIAGSYRLPQDCPAGRIARWNGSAWLCAAPNDHAHSAADVTAGTLANARFSAYGDLQAEGRLNDDAGDDLLLRQQADGRYWSLTGNGGVTAGNFLGTTTSTSLILKVNNTRALRLAPSGGTPNLVGGWEGNGFGRGAVGVTVAGGGTELIGSTDARNRVMDSYGAVGGGAANLAGSVDLSAANAQFATVGGGFSNIARAEGATIAGGQYNSAAGEHATVAGGEGNSAFRKYAAVGGGYLNLADGEFSTVPGGYYNIADGDFSFAAGFQARASHQGTFVWADSQQGTMSSTDDDQFIARASGRFFFQSDSTLDDQGGFINTSTGASLTPGGMWDNASDAALKENFAAVDGREVLRQVAALPISTWNYKAEGVSTRHIGPTAQAFAAAFGLGDDDKHIGTVDADGVALAAIQGLDRVVREKDARIAALQGEVAALEARVAAIESRAAPTESRGQRLERALILFGITVLVAREWRRRGSAR